jgi:ABC-type branched-subunit amino acid transport system substrate-binding protein
MQKAFPSTLRARSTIASRRFADIITPDSLLRGHLLSSSVHRFVAQSVFLFAISVPLFAYAQSPPVRLRIGLIVPANPSAPALSAARGVRLGAAESKQTAALFGGSVELYEATGSGAAGVNTAANQLLSQRKVQVLVAAAPEDVGIVSQFAELHKLAFMNVASRSTSLRSACRRYTFHVETPDVAYANAKALARGAAGAPATPSASAAMANPDSVMLWSSALERFGASQLNARYRTMFKAEMDAAAWAGWLAVKTVSEAGLRVRSADPQKLVGYLEAPSTQLDGHKGWPLTFRRADHQLRQPLYIVVASRDSRRTDSAIRDVPDIRLLSSGTQSPAILLDRLLARRGSRACSWLQL